MCQKWIIIKKLHSIIIIIIKYYILLLRTVKISQIYFQAYVMSGKSSVGQMGCRVIEVSDIWVPEKNIRPWIYSKINRDNATTTCYYLNLAICRCKGEPTYDWRVAQCVCTYYNISLLSRIRLRIFLIFETCFKF